MAILAYRIVVFATAKLRGLAVIEPDPLLRAQRQQRAETLRGILNNIARVVLLVFIVVQLLSEVGLDVRPIIAGAGILGIAIGFGAQSLVRDYLSGFFIVFENQFGVGDDVTIGGHNGIVERMTLRSTTLRDIDGGFHIVPNGKIESVVVHAREWARVTVGITPSYDEEIQRVLEVIANECVALQLECAEAVIGTPEVLGIDEFGLHGPTVSVSVRTRPGQQKPVARQLRLRIKSAFERERIKFAESTSSAEGPGQPDRKS